MQKEYSQNQGQNNHFTPHNPTVLYANQRPIQTQPQMMYRGILGQQQIRTMNVTQRLPYGGQQYMPSNNFNQVPPGNEMLVGYTGGFQMTQQPSYVQNGTQPYYQPHQAHPRYQQQGQILVPVQNSYQNQFNMVTPQTHNQQNTSQIVYQTQVGPTPPPQQQQPYIPHIQTMQQQQPQVQETMLTNKKRPTIRLTDPTTGKDLTNEVFKHKEKQPSTRHGGSFTAPNPPEEEKVKANANAKFAALVLQAKADDKSVAPEKTQAAKQAEISIKAPQEYPSKNENKVITNEHEKTIDKVDTQESAEVTKEEIPPSTEKVQDIVKTESIETDKTEPPVSVELEKPVEISTPEEVHISTETTKTEEVNQKEVTPETVETKLLETNNLEKLENTQKVEKVDVKEKIDEKVEDENISKEEVIDSKEEVIDSKKEIIVPKEEIIVPKEDKIVEAKPVEAITDSTKDSAAAVDRSTDSPTTGKSLRDSPATVDESQQDEAKTGSAFTVTKKKKSKNRFKDFVPKDKDDMLSAYKDAPPEKEEVVIEVKEVKPVEPLEDATWEDKEKSIEKEVIRNEDVEEPEVLFKTAETKIIKSEDQNQINTEEDKLQYDREFLLKFQFAPICTSKPAGLPNIDIVLDQAHAPTKALVPGQRISTSNDFMPTFMRSHSGGGKTSSGGRRGDRGDRRDRGPPPQNKPQKIIHVPAFEKVELKKSENAWVRPSEKAKDMSEQEREMDEVRRSVCSILNKLTPQKFKELVSQMLLLKVNSVEKLEVTCDLIFEKAVSEPNFCVPYANMCRVLTESFKVPVQQGEGKPPQIITFRKILLNKCQKEFEKESTDEKTLEEDRSKTFETEEERKAWKEELDFREMKNRRRMLGNIRFIGELFKFQMISENIMHDCIFKLLRSDKQDPVEDNLECLCKLLSTIGKSLDHKQAKRRIDQYFNQMNKIIEKKKISSRIKFALKDVIDLRSNDWVPRRDEGNPKTIDQIHKEAEQKEKQKELQRQQEKLQKKVDPRGGRGGRDSPVVRGSGAPPMGDGWTNVASKGRTPITSAPVDVSKFKMMAKKDTSAEVSLGPGGMRPGVWSRGASGGSSRSGSGSNTPTNEVEQRAGNRFDALTDSNVTASSLDNKRGSRGSQSSKRGTPPFGNTRRDEKSAALRAVSDFTGGRSSRNQSPARSGPPSGAQTPVEGARSPVNQVTEDKMIKVTKSTIEEFLSCRDLREAVLCIKELEASHLHHVFVQEAITVVIEKKSEHRRMVGSLLHRMIKENVLTIPQICKGVEAMVEFAPDFAVDVPLIYKYFGEIIGCIVYDGTVPLNKIKDTLEPLVQHNKAGLVMAEALSVAVQLAGKEELVSALWSESSVTWDMLLNNNESVEDFIKDKNMQFTMAPPSNHNTQIQQELKRLLKEEHDKVTKNVITYIQDKVPPSIQCKPEFIRDLTISVCESTLRDKCSCDRAFLKGRKDILERYINSKKDLELHSVFALQKLVTELNHPIDLLKDLFEELYECDVISEETFYIWESSKDFPDGKGAALSSVKGFLNWLHKAEEEVNEDDSTLSNVSTTSTNAVSS